MTRHLRQAFFLAVAFVLGYGLAHVDSPGLAQSRQRPAYIVASAQVLKSDPTSAYGKRARAAHDETGVATPEFLGYAARKADVTVLEGEWPYEGFFIIEKYPSMEALKTFWYSPGYQEAIKLRQGFRKTNFIIAVEEREPR
jgi:uncharacterized protein (DUF1330 family)